MSRQLLYSILLISAALLIAAAMYALRPMPVEEERLESIPLVEVVAFDAASGPIPVLGSGTVQARDEVTIGAEVSGRLTYVHPAFREGGIVPAGATLLRIDESDYVNQVRVAEADVASQGIAVLEAEEEVEIAREELERFAARETASEAAGQTETRILPPREMEEIKEALNAAGATASSEEAAERGLATREPQLDSAKASRDRAQANLDDAKVRLGRTRVRAPFGGLVREESAAIGQLVQPGEPLGSLVATNAYEVRVSLTPDEAALIPGLLNPSRSRVPASVTYNYGGKLYRWPAFVDRANTILDSATRNIEVYLRVPSPLSGGRLAEEGERRAPPLLLGAFVNAEITGASLDTYAAVPADAVRPGNEVWVLRNGKLVILKVRVIQRSDEIAYITTPKLGEGGQLITSSLSAPIEGMPLRVIGAQTEAKAEPAESASE
ncbi:MAG: HlyD family efflux transporter periplasmic adaptor subunit [Pseudomonadota bacterium]